MWWFKRKMPKLSVIVTGRNDNFDGNFDDRLAIAMKRNIKHLPDAEFIFVEWNPYLDRPLTSQRLKNFFGDRIRYIVVDPRFHDGFCKIDGFLEYPPKNVGIRRATGDFIVCTNSDVVFSPELAQKMKGDLQKDIIYRANRVDIRCDYLNVTFPLNPKYKICENYGVTNACGDFLLLDKNRWFKLTGYCEAFPEQRLHKDSLAVHILMNTHKLPVVNLGWMTHWRHPSSWSNNMDKILQGKDRIVPKVGDVYWNYEKCGFVRNLDNWGLVNEREIEKNGMTWIV
jgi:hypothetical protein